MALTKEQLALRRTGISGTDVAKILGLNPWAGPADVLADKLGQAPPFRGNRRTDMGHYLEPKIRGDFAEAHGCRVVEPGTLRHASEPWALTTPDGLIPSARAVAEFNQDVEAGLEIKVVGERRARDWGEPGTDQIPRYVYPQCAWGMFVVDVPVWYVVAQIDLEPYEYVLRRDAELEEKMVSRCKEWYERHMVAGEPLPADGSAAFDEDLKRRFPAHDADLVCPTVQDLAVMAELRETLASEAHFQRRAELLKQQLKLTIAEHAGIETDDGKPITWRRSKDSPRTDWQAVAAEQRLLLDSIIAANGAAKSELVELLKRFDLEDLGDIHANHTTIRPGSRRFCMPRSWDKPKR